MEETTVEKLLTPLREKQIAFTEEMFRVIEKAYAMGVVAGLEMSKKK